MTRQWMIDPSDMCREHLLGEHKEVHQLVGSIRNHPHGHAIADGHAEKGQIDTSLIQERHDELVAEMRARGYDHDSPVKWDTAEYRAGIGSIDVQANRAELRERCPACATRMQLQADMAEVVGDV